MNRLKKSLGNQKGMTLVELSVGMVLFMLLALFATGALSSSLGQLYRARDYAEVNEVFDLVSQEILAEANRATQITFLENGEVQFRSQTMDSTFGVSEEGYLYRTRAENLVVPKNYYNNKTIAVEYMALDQQTPLAFGTYQKGDSLSFYVKISVLQAERDTYERYYAVKPLGMSTYG